MYKRQVRRRKGTIETTKRPGYEGMGLGLFIAKTLLERSGAELSFSNGSSPYDAEGQSDSTLGAVVKVIWRREKIDAKIGENAVASGQNEQITI